MIEAAEKAEEMDPLREEAVLLENCENFLRLPDQDVLKEVQKSYFEDDYLIS